MRLERHNMEKDILERENSWRSMLQQKDDELRRMNDMICEKDTLAEKLRTTIERQARGKQEMDDLMGRCKDYERRFALEMKEMQLLQSEVAVLQEANQGMKQALERSNQAHETLQTSHLDLVNRMKKEYNEEVEKRVRLESVIAEKDKSLDIAMQDHKEIFDELNIKIESITKEKEELECKLLHADDVNTSRLHNRIRSLLQRCLMSSAKDQLIWSFTLWKDITQREKYEESLGVMKKEYDKQIFQSLCHNVYSAIERRLMTYAKEELRWGMNKWKSFMISLGNRDELRTRVRAVIQRCFIGSARDHMRWALNIWRDITFSVSSKKVEDETLTSLRSKENQVVYATGLKDGALLSSESDVGLGLSAHSSFTFVSRVRMSSRAIRTPILDELCMKYGVR